MLKFILFVSLFSVISEGTPNSKPKILIDNDAGGDDAMAIFLALRYEQYFNGPQLVGLTTGNGNTGEDNVYNNNQKILKVANRQDVPIYRGAKSSLVITPDSGAYYGIDGLGDNDDVYTDLVPAKDITAVQALLHLSKTHEDLTVITLGTLTNVALAIKLDPEFLDRLSHLYVGAGHIHEGTDYKAEFNAHMDVESYHIVAQSARPDKVTFLPFSQVIEHLNISMEWRNDVLGAIDTEVIKAQNKFERVALAKNHRWQSLDPAAVAVALKPDLVNEYKYSKHDIALCGAERGIVSNNFTNKNESNARVIYSLKIEEYKQFMLDVFTAETKGAGNSLGMHSLALLFSLSAILLK